MNSKLSIAMEILEIQKKKIMEKSKNYDEMIQKLQNIENIRKDLINGDDDLIEKIILKYKNNK